MPGSITHMLALAVQTEGLRTAPIDDDTDEEGDHHADL